MTSPSNPWTALREKMELATEGSRELDAAITVHLPHKCGPDAILHLPLPHEHCAKGTYWLKLGIADSLWTAEKLTESLDAIVAVVKAEGLKWRIGDHDMFKDGFNGYYGTVYHRGERVGICYGSDRGCPTPALALCVAYVRYREATYDKG